MKVRYLIVILLLLIVGMGSWLRVGLASRWWQNLGNIALAKSLMNPGLDQKVVEPVSLLVAAKRYDQPAAYRNLSVFYMRNKEFKKAISSAQAALLRASNDYLAAYQLGEAYWESERKDQARQIWRASGAIQGKLDRLIWKCWHYWNHGNSTSAEAALREAIDIDPEYGPAYDALASILWGKQQHRGEEAILALERARRYLPRSSSEWYWSDGRLHLMKGEWKLAVESLQAAVNINAAEWPMRFLADAFERYGDVKAAAQVRAEIQKRWGK